MLNGSILAILHVHAEDHFLVQLDRVDSTRPSALDDLDLSDPGGAGTVSEQTDPCIEVDIGVERDCPGSRPPSPVGARGRPPGGKLPFRCPSVVEVGDRRRIVPVLRPGRRSSSTASLQMARTIAMSWLTNTIVVPSV